MAAGWIVEFDTGEEWRQAAAGRKWGTARAAEGFRRRWAAQQKRDASWEPPTRVVPLLCDGSALIVGEPA